MAWRTSRRVLYAYEYDIPLQCLGLNDSALNVTETDKLIDNDTVFNISETDKTIDHSSYFPVRVDDINMN